MKSRKLYIHESRRYDIFFGIFEIAIKVVIAETLAELLSFFFYDIVGKKQKIICTKFELDIFKCSADM